MQWLKQLFQRVFQGRTVPSEVIEAGPVLVQPEVAKTETHNLRCDDVLPCCAFWLRSSETLFYEYS